ncbi:MAG: extracellular elastinolytic metalloproteinase [Acidobacteriota bacterium]|jgi:extracellular elastinolytic metalloproteinase|nr:extracellular elastinolytic metalloproteinase [Acidobacteriota bacterium]
MRTKALWLAVLAALGGLPLAAQLEGNRPYDARIAQNANLKNVTPALMAQVAALRSARPDLLVEYDDAAGTTRSLYNPGGNLSDAKASNLGIDPLLIAQRWAEAHKAALGLTSADLAQAAVNDRVSSPLGGTTHLYLRQTFKGLTVYSALLQLNLDRQGRVMSVNNSFQAGLATSINTLTPGIDAAKAVASAARHLKLDAAPRQLGSPSGVDQRTGVDNAGLSRQPIAAHLMLLPIRRGETHLVWNFLIYTLDSQHVYDLTVDAVTGQVWTRFDLVASDTYKVYPKPVESPNHTAPLPPADGRGVLTNPAFNPGSPFGWHDTNGVTGAEFTTLRGNNVHAYDDIDANDLPPGSEPNCGITLNCSSPINLAGAPSTYTPAAVANLFYWNNVVHDVQFQYGFNSPSGNFQTNIYGAGGLGNDEVQAEAQDGGGMNNANFFTPVDGQRPRMQMYLWSTATPQKDGDLDSGVIVHEYGHGISNRLVGGPSNVTCLVNPQQPGEGLSDWWALAYTHKAGDQGTDGRGIGTYVLNQPTTGPGIRAKRYSTDPAINNWTYASINGMAIPHGVGSVWAEAAWRAYWALVDKWGFDPNLYNATGGSGNQRMMLYVNEGLKFTACNPTFTQVRDGILQAASVNYGGVDVCPLWVAFAAFGLGSNAVSGGPNSTTPTNGFAVPPQCRTDVWIQDTPSDTGLEPDPATVGQPMWQSQDIWVRNSLTNGPHENPEYGQVNYIHVRVRNRSSVAAANVPVKVYFANASVGLSWPANWTLINTGNVVSLAPGASTEVVVPWSPPGPPPPSHFCLVARLDTAQDPMTFPETTNIDLNVRNNNNIAWRNVNVVDLIPFQIVKATFNVRNPGPKKLRSKIIFREQRGGEGFLKRGRVMIDLSKLAARWQEGRREGKGFRTIDGHTIEVENGGYIIVTLNGREEFDLGLTFEDTARRASTKPTTDRQAARPAVNRYGFEIVQEDADHGKELGGIAYQIVAPVPVGAPPQ